MCSALSTFRTALEVYEYLCRPACRAEGIQQGELDVLLFLDNHPGMDTAMEVHRYGGIKQSMLSTLVEKLVQGGYLERQPVSGDRRKVRLICTEKAMPVIQAGREAQKKYFQYILKGASEEDLAAYERIKQIVERNILSCRERMLKGELE